jgi:Phage terminase-like protein, large subunit
VSYAEQYTDAVLTGDIIAGKKIIQACKRFKNDLKRQNTDEFPYYFDEDIEQRIIQLVELLPTTDGKKLHLAMFQKWILSQLYSWREVGTGNKRFDRAFISMARKNSKTYLASTMGVIALLMEKEPQQGRQVLFTANAYKQARLAYDMMASELRQVVKASPYIRQRLKLERCRLMIRTAIVLLPLYQVTPQH